MVSPSSENSGHTSTYGKVFKQQNNVPGDIWKEYEQDSLHKTHKDQILCQWYLYQRNTVKQRSKQRGSVNYSWVKLSVNSLCVWCMLCLWVEEWTESAETYPPSDRTILVWPTIWPATTSSCFTFVHIILPFWTVTCSNWHVQCYGSYTVLRKAAWPLACHGEHEQCQSIAQPPPYYLNIKALHCCPK